MIPLPIFPLPFNLPAITPERAILVITPSDSDFLGSRTLKLLRDIPPVPLEIDPLLLP